jgi:hypothetical protein
MADCDRGLGQGDSHGAQEDPIGAQRDAPRGQDAAAAGERVGHLTENDRREAAPEAVSSGPPLGNGARGRQPAAASEATNAAMAISASTGPRRPKARWATRPSSHRNADIGLPQRRAVVHAVTGHRDHVATLPQGAGDAQLVLERDSGDHGPVAIDDRAEHLLVIGQVGADHDRAVKQQQPLSLGDRGGGGWVVAGHHRQSHTGAAAGGHGLGRILPWRVGEPDKTQQLPHCRRRSGAARRQARP